MVFYCVELDCLLVWKIINHDYANNTSNSIFAWPPEVQVSDDFHDKQTLIFIGDL